MDTLEKLEGLKDYIGIDNRRAFNTDTMVKGSNKHTTILVHTDRYASVVREDLTKRGIPFKKVIGLERVRELAGHRGPLLVDHSALLYLIDGVAKDFDDMRRTFMEQMHTLELKCGHFADLKSDA